MTYNPETGQPEKEPPPSSKKITGKEGEKTSFKDWQAEQVKDPEFVAALKELEPKYQIARLRIRHGLTQAQLAEMVDVREVTIARLERGTRISSPSLFRRIAQVLNARIELKIIPENAKITKE